MLEPEYVEGKDMLLIPRHDPSSPEGTEDDEPNPDEPELDEPSTEED